MGLYEMTDKVEIEKSFSDACDERSRHDDVINQRTILHAQVLDQNEVHHKDILKQNDEFNKKRLEQEKEIEEHRYGQYEKCQKKRDRGSKIAVGISIIALIVSSLIAFYGVNKAFELNEPYLIPRDPTIKNFWIGSSTVFSTYQLSNVWDNRKPKKIEICMYNEGRNPTGHILTYIIDEHLDDYYVNIPNIDGGETNCTTMFLMNSDCEFINGSKVCNESSLPIGDRELTFFVDCKYCHPQEFNLTDNICIWGNDSTVCID